MKRAGLRSAGRRLTQLTMFAIVAFVGQSVAFAQGRGGAAWTTIGGDAQRTASMKSDPRITKESVAKNFQLLWTRALDSPSRQPNALTQPVLLPNIISYKGFKALAFVGGSADNVYALDYDLSRLFWHRHLETGAPSGPTSASCPGGLTTITRATPLAQSIGGGRGGRGRGQPPTQEAPAAAGRGVAPPPPSTPPMPGSGPGPNAALGGVAGRGGNNNVYAISSGGKLHALNPQDGSDMVPPIAFLPAGAKAVGSVLIDTLLYVATTGNCGGAPNGVWAIDLAGDANTITKWETKGGIIGDGLAVGLDGTVYVATSNEVVALTPKTLDVKARFSDGAGPFTSSPIVLGLKGRNVVVVGRKNALVLLIDDGTTFLAASAPVSSGGAEISAVAATDEGTTKWVFAAVAGPVEGAFTTNGAVTNGGVVTFKLAEDGHSVTAQPAWASRDLTSPVTPLIINGVVFALATGERATSNTGRSNSSAQRSPTLYALDAATGKELWNSGNALAPAVRGVAPSGGDGQVYVVSADGTVYAFGIPTER